MENEPNADLQQADDPAGWDVVASTITNLEGAQLLGETLERKRCLSIVTDEIAKGIMRGIPATSGAMVVLARIAAAIEHGA